MTSPANQMFYHFFLRVLMLAAPIGFSRIVYLLSSFIAIMMLGTLGKLQLAAAAIAISTFSVVLVFSSSIFQALSILIRRTSKNHSPPAENAALFQASINLALGIGFIAALFLWHADRLLILTRQDSDIIHTACLYFKFSALAIIPSLFISVINQFTIGLGRARSLIYIELFSFFPKIVLYYGFIHGYFGLSPLGLAGVALTELLIKVLVLIILIFRITQGIFYKPYLPYLNIKFWQLNQKLMKSLLSIGLPIALQSSGEITAMSAAGYLMGYFGPTALAALSITNQYMIPVMMLAYGLSQSLTLLMSETNKWDYPHSISTNYLISALCIMAIYTTPFVILFLKYPLILSALIIPANLQDPLLQTLCTYFFSICALFIVIDGIRNLIIGALWAISDSHKPVMASLSMIWFIALPLSYIFGFTLNGGAVGLRLGFLAGILLSLLLLGYKLFHLLPMPVNRA
ncbi:MULTISPECIES: MATE family efflux transporter [unclassified Legionella]|uniref:MATE family efflux transporter n=1 Tax=unclassified Legionella TaxID=2622702 RepID=UPI001056D9A7|nr:MULTISPECIES: MATE family efflux transporter [unclassified Legionella]MDI9817795.1 MATE family efflux transporter [Legionella sp. PL877]